jgi:tryptophanyl-tRNA synthetase
MAADILLYQTNLVPIGADQKQHLELCRNIAQRFNGVYGDVFTIPEPLISKTGARIMSLQEPEKKMSKSDLGEGSVFLLDDPDVIRRKIRRAVTDSETEIRFDPENKPGVSNLLTIYSALSGMSIPEVEAKFDGAGYGDLKKSLVTVTQEALTPIRDRFDQIRHSSELDDILDDGAARARALAEPVLDRVKEHFGIGRLK